MSQGKDKSKKTIDLNYIPDINYKQHFTGNFKSKRNHYRNKNQIKIGDKGKEVLESLDKDNPVIKQFEEYAKELNDKHDCFERLVKISRDIITIESKRIIFLLHTFDKESKRDAILGEAQTRLNNLMELSFKNIALELDGEDPYLYIRAYRPGLQEFVEAITFYWFLKNNTLYNWIDLAKHMNYNISDPSQTENNETTVEQKSIQALLPPIDYILGIADLTGKLMRKCINNLAIGDIASCYQTCNFVRNTYTGFLGCLGISGREISKKIFTLRQSLLKMENVCYVIKVRGSEIPKHMLADVAIAESTENMIILDDDEGYQVD